MKICTLCNKNFRDNYALERHQNKKKPCVNSVINKNNQSQPVVVLNNFGEEDIEHITNDIFTNLFYHIHNGNDDGNEFSLDMISQFHRLINENKYNNNVELSTDSENSRIFIENVWQIKSNQEITNMVIKKRVDQILKYMSLIS